MIESGQAWRGARRVALVADSHGCLADGLPAALAGADLIVHAGDVGSAAVLHELARLAPVLAVRGNNDVASKWPAAEEADCAALVEVQAIGLAGGTLVVVHGHQWPATATRHRRLRSRFPDARCIVYGHSHRRVLDLAESPWVVNPGAAGRARAHGGAGWLGLEVTPGAWRVAVDAFPR